MLFPYTKPNIAFFLSAVNSIYNITFFNSNTIGDNIIEPSINILQFASDMVDIFLSDLGIGNIFCSSIIPHLSLIVNGFALIFRLFFPRRNDPAVLVGVSLFGKGVFCFA